MFLDQVNRHRTIREFTDQKISDGDIDTILKSTMRTATSVGMQMASIIRVKDQDKKDQIAKICNQDYVARAPELMVFIVDFYRNNRIILDTGQSIDKDSDVDIFFQGFTDAALMAQNMTNIVESMGMGAVFLGSILNDTEKIIEILSLPELTFPVLGLGFGYPNQDPQLKPRMDYEFRVFEDEYKIYDDYSQILASYDEELTSYYDLRDQGARSDSFFNQVVQKANSSNPKRQEIINVARKNGFKL